MEAIIVDTGIIYAAMDKTDKWHKTARDFLSVFDGRLIIPSSVITETCYLLHVCDGQSLVIAFINSLSNVLIIMPDTKKFKILILLTAVLTILILSYNVLSEYLMPEIEGYMQRRFYYEGVISKKGLSLHKGMYWKEKENPSMKKA